MSFEKPCLDLYSKEASWAREDATFTVWDYTQGQQPIFKILANLPGLPFLFMGVTEEGFGSPREGCLLVSPVQ
jgi:hypothetical protein